MEGRTDEERQSIGFWQMLIKATGAKGNGSLRAVESLWQREQEGSWSGRVVGSVKTAGRGVGIQ